jgi:thiol-disulfide isomerase/thioredoxin
MSRGRSGLTRFEIMVTVVMVVLAIGGIAALVPLSGRGSGGPAPTGSASKYVQLDDTELAGPRQAADLQPCPTGRPPEAVPAATSGGADTGGQETGPLAGIVVPCLGAPGQVRPALAFAGRETLINVWASWCPPCREELPALAAYAAQPDALPVVGIDVRDNPVKALKLLTDLKIHLPMLADSGNQLADVLSTVALPASFVVHADGEITQLLPQVAYTEAHEVADAVAKVRKK